MTRKTTPRAGKKPASMKILAKPKPLAKPAKAVAKPKPVAKPAKAVAKPAKLVAKPAKVVAKPAKVVAKPAKVVAKPLPEVKPTKAVAKPAKEPAAPVQPTKAVAAPKAPGKGKSGSNPKVPGTPKPPAETPLDRVRTALERHGLLMLADNVRPAVAQLVVGAPIPGSWWGHAKGKVIYAVASALENDPDVATAKLVDGKVTFVHRRLWPALVAVGSEVARWQTDGLSPAATDLFDEVEINGRMASEDRELDFDAKTRRAAFGAVAERLLAATHDEHTTSGAHSTVVESWEAWSARRGVGKLPNPKDARAELAAAIARLGGGGTPPWERRR
jgi:hypothetical protein